MLLKVCPMCGCKEMKEISELGCKCSNCDEIFKYNEKFEAVPAPLEEWVEYLNTRKETFLT